VGTDVSLDTEASETGAAVITAAEASVELGVDASEVGTTTGAAVGS